MGVDPVPHIRPVRHPVWSRQFSHAGTDKLTQQTIDASQLPTGFRQRAHLVLAELWLARQLRADQRHNPAVSAQACRPGPLIYGSQFRRRQPDLDAGARFANHGSDQIAHDGGGLDIALIIMDRGHDQLAGAFAGRQTTTRTPVVPAQPDGTEFDAQTLTRGHDLPQRDGDIGAGAAGSRSISGARVRSGAERLR
ncbi:hypothetical protein C7399_13133 [Paraburkholderia tropica]|uniref:Uncharacterized protein n=1 Tax=Paraburkholderia tropica TaxID=92647 RepID=A0ABX5MG84_9BURK|nr:hypothetical protein C7400_13134 [Paraburkholderia tropica]PZW72701.1 hypothetical protein C7399_13133 [Paraburkholderia tropica]